MSLDFAKATEPKDYAFSGVTLRATPSGSEIIQGMSLSWTDTLENEETINAVFEGIEGLKKGSFKLGSSHSYSFTGEDKIKTVCARLEELEAVDPQKLAHTKANQAYQISFIKGNQSIHFKA